MVHRRDVVGGTQRALARSRRWNVIRITLFEDFRCPLCEDFGIVEVTVEPAFGLASERPEPEREWRVCQCRQSEVLADIGGEPRAARRGQ